MRTLATIHWGYVGLVLVGVCALVAGRFLIALIRYTRAIANASTDDFRLGKPNMWTEAHHTSDGGSFQLMRLNDGNFVLISVGVTTVKVLVTPDRTDVARYRELKDFPLLKGLERAQWPPQKRHSEDLLVLHRVRQVIAWPTSADELSAILDATDRSFLNAIQSA
jgi:hypothetical protein